MKKSESITLATLLTLATVSMSGCAPGGYYDYSYDYVDYGEPDIIICPGPPLDPGPIVVTERRPRPLPKPEVKPPTRTKEPERQPRTPAPRTPKPRTEGVKKSPRAGQVRR